MSLCKIGKFFLPAMFGTIFLLPQALACTCPPITSPKREMERAEGVFSGKVINANVPNRRLRINLTFPFIHSIQRGSRIEFSVEEVWKGKASPQIAIMATPQFHGCNISFKEGDEYIVYAYGEKDGMYTHKCTRTTLLIDASEDLTQLGSGVRPEHPTINLAFPAIGSLLLALALPVLIIWIYCLNRERVQSE